MKTVLQLFALGVLLFFVANNNTSYGQGNSKYWIPGNHSQASTKTIAAHQLVFTADINGLQTRLRQIEGTNETINVPGPDGTFFDFKITKTDVLIPELALAHPEIKTYRGTSTDGYTQLRLTISPYGVNAMIATIDKGLVYLQPTSNTAPSSIVCYYVRDLIAPSVAVYCGVKDNGGNIDDEYYNNTAQRPTTLVTGKSCDLRTYVISVAATGEYTNWAGGQSQALAAITTTINNVNAIYERDLGVHFTLNSPNSILYTDASTDPYPTTTSPSSATLTANQTAVTTNIGSANFNLGDVFNAGWSGGLASTPSACNSSTKAQAACGLDPTNFPTGPSGPVFDGTVAHETGHQFSSTHSFAANNGSCNGNVTGTTAWEPGGGSTIMAYAGTCTGNSYQSNSDLYFHGGNLAQMANYITNSISTCGTINTTLGNSNPSTTVSQNAYTIPVNTPFQLTLQATDVNGDVLTYDWEEMDPFGGTGTSNPPTATATTGPQFRSFPPTASPIRYFPSFSDLITGNTTYEVLPSVARTMNFRGTARDNHAGDGCTSGQDVTVSTLAGCTGFSITSHNTAASFTANGTNTTTLTWNTATGCVACANVNILFSTDGGLTYPYTLLSNTPNDGTQTITVPNVNTCSGRFMVACSSNIFYNINSANQSITSSCTANGSTISPATNVSANAGSSTLNLSMSPAYGTALTIAGSITSTDPVGTLTTWNTTTSSCVNYNGNITNYDTYSFVPSATGSYTFSAGSSTANLVYNLYAGSFNPNDPCSNLIVSSATGSGSITLNSSITATLCSSQTYIMVVSSFGPSTPPLPAPYSMTVTGGSLYTGTPQPSGMNYAYVIVNSAGNIKAIATTADLSNAVAYPDDTYTVYGISTSSTATSLNTTYVGTSFSSFSAAVLNQTSGICASLSTNSRKVIVGSGTPLPIHLLAFDAALINKSSSNVHWIAANESGLKSYLLERSYDALNFSEATLIQAKNSGQSVSYNYIDAGLNNNYPAVYYRLLTQNQSGAVEYSNIVKLALERYLDPSLIVSPNPIKENILNANINVPDDGTYQISITDMTGRNLYQQNKALQKGTHAYTFDVRTLAAGVYIIRLSGNNVLINTRFVK